MASKMDLSQFRWIHQPNHYQIKNGDLTITTDPQTDFWQRTYYGFQHDNAHAFLLSLPEQEFSFIVKTAWEPKMLYDQCGVIFYQDSNNWVKASVEYENDRFSRLGSVVTNLGYSDWATTDIPSSKHQMVYRLSRRGQDFLIENSDDGLDFKQMRIFHMHSPIDLVNLGVYACSPLNSSFQALFSDFTLGKCTWELHVNQDA